MPLKDQHNYCMYLPNMTPCLFQFKVSLYIGHLKYASKLGTVLITNINMSQARMETGPYYGIGLWTYTLPRLNVSSEYLSSSDDTRYLFNVILIGS